jgi:hypothetical protein
MLGSIIVGVVFIGLGLIGRDVFLRWLAAKPQMAAAEYAKQLEEAKENAKAQRDEVEGMVKNVDRMLGQFKADAGALMGWRPGPPRTGALGGVR